MSDAITARDLQPADVMLSASPGVVGRMIKFFDGAPYSHAALYLGDGQVGEAVSPKLLQRDLETAISHSIQVDVRRLKERPADVEPVLGRARAYLAGDERYGYEQILLLVLLALTRKVRVNRTFNRILRRLLDGAAATLLDFVRGNTQPMICSEFVYRVYDEATTDAPNPFSLRIVALRPAAAPRALGAPAPPGAEAPDAAPPSGLGQGVHPDSVLARAIAAPIDDEAPRVAPPAAMAAPAAPKALDEAELETLFDEYVDELKRPVPAAAPSPAAMAAPADDLRVSLDRFAAAFHRATAPPPPAAAPGAPRAMAAPAGRARLYDHLFKTAADFVTPGDLFTSQSLFPVGRLK